MNKQEIFDKVATHLLAQNRQSQHSDSEMSSCAYRGICGTACAIGCLIPDDLYDASMEGLNVYSKDVQLVLLDAGVMTTKQFGETKLGIGGGHGSEFVDFLGGLQGIHDTASPSHWRDQLSAFAEDHSLSAAALAEFVS